MNAIGIDVSKGKSTVAVLRPFGEIVLTPFDTTHSVEDLKALISKLSSIEGESRVVMEYTGNYHAPIANALYEAGFFVSVINPLLIHDYGNNSLRRAKTDKKDALKIAAYALDRWLDLPKYIPEDETRQILKIYHRQSQQLVSTKTALKNNLISLTDQTFPGVNVLFASHTTIEGREKWLDFTETFWHAHCVSKFSKKAFCIKYEKWCKKHHYKYSAKKAINIYDSACNAKTVLPSNDTVKVLISTAVKQLQTVSESLANIQNEMNLIASRLPEYNTVISMYGVGKLTAPQLIADIGDIRRFTSKKALVAFAGVDAPPYQSGTVDVKSRSISKRGCPSLRKTLFVIMAVLLKSSNLDNPVYQFIDKKRSEGKPYRVYMIAAANKFLRIYYAKVSECLNNYSV